MRTFHVNRWNFFVYRVVVFAVSEAEPRRYTGYISRLAIPTFGQSDLSQSPVFHESGGSDISPGQVYGVSLQRSARLERLGAGGHAGRLQLSGQHVATGPSRERASRWLDAEKLSVSVHEFPLRKIRHRHVEHQRVYRNNQIAKSLHKLLKYSGFVVLSCLQRAQRNDMSIRRQ